MQDLINSLDRDLTYAIEVEGKMHLADVSNYNEVCHDVVSLPACSLHDPS